MGGIFEQARAAIDAAVIEKLLNAPGAYWEGAEYWTLNPTRSDNSVGSFSINENGAWYDHAIGAGGDLIDLVAEMRNGTKKEAAEEIVRAAGGVVRDEEKKPKKTAALKKKRDKVKPMIPAPEDALKKLNPALRADWVTKRHGAGKQGWTYRTAEGGVAFCVSRHEKPDGSKDVLPWYYGEDGAWHMGQAYETGRPLYKLDQILATDYGTPVLVVEGEKCASVDVVGYMVTSWSGGSKATTKTDWAPLEGREVIIWPDADDAGLQAARAIARRLPDAKILEIKDKPKGWDLADAVAEGVDPRAFIESVLPTEARTGRHDDGLPFLALGHDSVSHWFMRRDVRIPFPIGRGSFNQSKLLEVAPLAFWGSQGDAYFTSQGSVKVAAAQDLLMELSTEAGTYDQTILRGAGVWRDGDGIVLNDGEKLILPDGSVHQYDEHRSRYVYIKSAVRFGALVGPESTDEDGQKLEELFRAQSWSDPSVAPLAMGWSLIAPFGGLLRWRPHIWITGRKGSGKSYMMENLVAPLCGPFAHRGSGKDTEAGIRRSLNMDARPVILDEMEPKSARARDKVQSLLELARNASSDGSGVITIGGGADGGAVTFVIRSCFAFASVQVPDEDAAVASRIIRMELRPEVDQAAKFALTDRLYADCMQDPSRYTRRIYRALSRINGDIEWIRTAYLDIFGEQRRVDQVAPLLAAAWAAQSGEALRYSNKGRAWLAQWIDRLANAAKEAIVEDEDAVMRHLVGAQIRTDGGYQRTVAELLQEAAERGEAGEANDILSRQGIRFYVRDGERFIAVANDVQHVKKILAGTPYESGYAAQLRRHKLCATQDGALPVVRFKSGQARAVLIEWRPFADLYLGGGEMKQDQPDLGGDYEQEDNPF